jgi:hypothetical protein
MTLIGSLAFANCSALTSITLPTSLITLGEGLFFQSGVTSLTIPATVITIGFGAFIAANLSSITFLNPNIPTITEALYLQGYGFLLFSTTPASGTITISASANLISWINFTVSNDWRGNVTSGGAPTYTLTQSAGVINGFTGSFTDGVLRIPATLGGVTITGISNSVFLNQTTIILLIISASITNTGTNTFQGCTALTTVYLPQSITTIGNSAFQGCTSLINIPNIYLLPSLTTIGTSAFQGCTSLPGIIVPQSLTTIGASAFQECSGLIFAFISRFVTSIGASAFSGCTALTDISFEATSVPTFGATVFASVPSTSDLIITTSANLTSWTTASTNAGWTGSRRQYSFGTSNNNGLVVNSVTGTLAPRLVIPAFIDGQLVKNIGGGYVMTVANRTTTTSLLIRAPAYRMQASAFVGFTKLTNVVIPNTMTTIENSVFSGCTTLSAIEFLGVTPPTFGTTVFASTPSAGVITIPSTGNTSTWSPLVSAAGWTGTVVLRT